MNYNAVLLYGSHYTHEFFNLEIRVMILTINNCKELVPFIWLILQSFPFLQPRWEPYSQALQLRDNFAVRINVTDGRITQHHSSPKGSRFTN